MNALTARWYGLDLKGLKSGTWHQEPQHSEKHEDALIF